MSEKQPAVINISKILKDVSLPTIAAIGSATGNIWIAGAAAVPAAIAASDTLKSLLQKKQEEHLELSAPPWWTKSAQSWQITCASIENGLPAAMNSMAERLRKEGTIPTTVQPVEKTERVPEKHNKRKKQAVFPLPFCRCTCYTTNGPSKG